MTDTRTAETGVQFFLTGEMTRANGEIFEKYSSLSIIKHLGIIPYDEVLALQRSADILINVDSDIKDPEQAVFFPSKLLDYMVAQRRILAITNHYSTTHDVVNGKLGDCFDFDDVDGLVLYFQKALEHFRKRQMNYFCMNSMGEEFSAKKNVERLSLMFKELMK